MFQLRDRLFAGTAHEMAHPKRSKSQFFRNKACYREIFRRSNFLQRFGPMLPSRNVSCNRASEEWSE